jgi:hypothetical protein
MKLNLFVFALVILLGCTTSPVLASTCSESSGLCVCSGECPAFTNDWAGLLINDGSCVVTKSSGSSTSFSDGVVTVNGQTYTNIDSCDGATTGSSAGMFGAYYASVLVAAAAVTGGVAAL